jgi:hypothetical protein
MQGRGRGNVAAERLCGALFVGLTTLKGYFYTNRGGTQTAPARQQTYLRALESLPKVAIFYGNFLVAKKWSGLVQPVAFRPAFTLPAGAAPKVAYVWKTEEKGSDVNLGVHLVRDAFCKQ